MSEGGRGVGRLWNLAGLWRRGKPEVGLTPSTVVHAENKWRLLRYDPREEGETFDTPVLMVPSLSFIRLPPT